MNSEQNIQHSIGDETRAGIVRAARECFRQFGYAKTSMQEIAQASGMSAANLYRFYDGKLAIGVAVAEAERAALLTMLDGAVLAAGPDVTDRLIALFQTNIDATRRKLKRTPHLFELDLLVSRETKALREQFLHEMEERLVAILSPSPGPGGFESAAIRIRSRMILMASAPFVLPWMMLNEPFGNPRPMVEPLIRSLFSGICADPSATLLPAPTH